MESTDTNTDYFLSCDWGTSSFRLKLADSTTGSVQEAVKTSQGIKDIYDSWSETGKKQERELYYYRYLQKNISLLAKKAGRNLDGVPLVLSGMASSSIGIKELPYASLPLSLKDPKLQLDVREGTEDFPHKVILVSGIRTSHDVMRGEETQLIGFAVSHTPGDGICILPGTHSKHIFIEDNKIMDLKTFLTGELFDLLSTKSVLKNSVLPGESFHADAFRQGVQQSLRENMLNALFKIRAEDILHHTDPEENYYFLSGLLVGTELAELRKYSSTRLFLLGEDRLQQLYATALHVLELDHLSIETTGKLAVGGHRYILNKIRT